MIRTAIDDAHMKCDVKDCAHRRGCIAHPVKRYEASLFTPDLSANVDVVEKDAKVNTRLFVVVDCGSYEASDT